MPTITCGSLDELSAVLMEEMAQPDSGSPALLVMPGFVSQQDAKGLCRKFNNLLNESGSSIYSSSATPLYEYREASGRAISHYLDEAAAQWREHSQILTEFGDPIQRFMVGLSDRLYMPVERLRLLDRQCFFGQYRCFGQNEEIQPHVDALQHEFPNLLHRRFKRQWAVNIMLGSPAYGGDLEIWNSYPTADEYIGYGFTRPSAIPAICFHPSVGDLYLFQPGYLHAVRGSSGPRCALSGFLAGPWPDRSMRVWS